ncbi:radical SAM family heme chaperone HemW [Methylomarinum vadi]|uniref:radical SAM family heme chaperone HemW n=1 Tax=Methylomarinum vadi TaxID=438855 RepID=UPI0004DED226|nr:radical SAM family heme chaperone HemW [Methylomarinum vadi]
MNRLLTQPLPTLGLYIHIPWCIQKCPYCDFNSHAMKEPLPETVYIDTLLNDLQRDIEEWEINRPIETIFIGGGTPSLFSAQAMERLLNGIQKQALLAENLEITLEANPGTFESDKFADFRRIGINRLSIGIQSFNDRHLKTLGRVHNSAEAMRAVEMAFRSGFDNINLDLMFGLPGQSLHEAIEDVETAVKLSPAHISYYQLTLEPNTWFHKFPPSLPQDEDIYRFQQAGQRLLSEQGYRQYEISAYAQQGKICRHNQNYWRFGDYLGIGAGAHGKISLALPDNIIRTMKSKRPEHYLQQQDSKSSVKIDIAQLPLEFVMNHLRLKSGFTAKHYRAVTGLGMETLEPALSECVNAGLLIYDNEIYRCSERGWNFLDSILEKFIA